MNQVKERKRADLISETGFKAQPFGKAVECIFRVRSLDRCGYFMFSRSQLLRYFRKSSQEDCRFDNHNNFAAVAEKELEST